MRETPEPDNPQPDEPEQPTEQRLREIVREELAEHDGRMIATLKQAGLSA